MTSESFCNRGVPRKASSHAEHCWFSARHTCSIVTSGFFPPQPVCLTSHECQCHTAQHHVPHQRHIVPALKVSETELTFAHPETVFHVPATEADTQQTSQRCARRSVGHE